MKEVIYGADKFHIVYKVAPSRESQHGSSVYIGANQRNTEGSVTICQFEINT